MASFGTPRRNTSAPRASTPGAVRQGNQTTSRRESRSSGRVWTLTVRGGLRRTVDAGTIRALAILGALTVVFAVIVLIVLADSSPPTTLTESEMTGLRPAVDAAISAKLGVPIKAPLVIATPTAFTLRYKVGRGALTFDGQPTVTPCSATVTVSRSRSTATELSWQIAKAHPCVTRGHREAPSSLGRMRAIIGPFAVGSAGMTQTLRKRMAHIANKLAGAQQVTCVGYADDLGSRSYNLQLGYRRAHAACATLRADGARARLRAISMGEADPRASNRTAAGRARNRRVELRLTSSHA